MPVDDSGRGGETARADNHGRNVISGVSSTPNLSGDGVVLRLYRECRPVATAASFKLTNFRSDGYSSFRCRYPSRRPLGSVRTAEIRMTGSFFMGPSK